MTNYVTDYHIVDLDPGAGYTGSALAVGGPLHGKVIVFTTEGGQPAFGPTVAIEVSGDHPWSPDGTYYYYGVSPLDGGAATINGVTITHQAVVEHEEAPAQ